MYLEEYIPYFNMLDFYNPNLTWLAWFFIPKKSPSERTEQKKL